MDVIIYHGSSQEICEPKIDKGKSYNDYGKGFYSTKFKNEAAMWACKFRENGIVNQYTLDLDNLKVLYLDEKHNILNWLAILVDNRKFTSEIVNRNKEVLLKHYLIDYKKYDVIIGYRADDAYFRFVRDFLSNQIPIRVLAEAMYLGESGLQIFLQSKKAFETLHFVKSEIVEFEEFYYKFQIRTEKANAKYLDLIEETQTNDIYIRDLLGGEIDETSIPRIKIK